MKDKNRIENSNSVGPESEIRERFLCLNSMDANGDVPVNIKNIDVKFEYSGNILYNSYFSSGDMRQKQIGTHENKSKLKEILGVKYSSYGPRIKDTDKNVEDYYTIPIVKVHITYTYRDKSDKTVKHISKGCPKNFLKELYKKVRSNFSSIKEYNQSDSTISGYYNFKDAKLKVDKRNSGVKAENVCQRNELYDSVRKFDGWMSLWVNEALSREDKILEASVSDVRYDSSKDKIYILVDCNYDTVVFDLDVKESEDSDLWSAVKSYAHGDLAELKQSKVLLVHSKRLLENQSKSHRKNNIISDRFNEFFLILNPTEIRDKYRKTKISERLSISIPSFSSNTSD